MTLLMNASATIIGVKQRSTPYFLTNRRKASFEYRTIGAAIFTGSPRSANSSIILATENERRESTTGECPFREEDEIPASISPRSYKSQTESTVVMALEPSTVRLKRFQPVFQRAMSIIASWRTLIVRSCRRSITTLFNGH